MKCVGQRLGGKFSSPFRATLCELLWIGRRSPRMAIRGLLCVDWIFGENPALRAAAKLVMKWPLTRGSGL